MTTAIPTSFFRTRARGQVSIWEMNGNTLIGGGPVSPNPGPSLASDRDRRLQPRRLFRHPFSKHEHRPSLDLGDEREQTHRRRTGQPQSRAELARHRNRRRFRHPFSKHQRPSLDLGHEREQPDRRRAGQPQSRAELASGRAHLIHEQRPHPIRTSSEELGLSEAVTFSLSVSVAAPKLVL